MEGVLILLFELVVQQLDDGAPDATGEVMRLRKEKPDELELSPKLMVLVHLLLAAVRLALKHRSCE